MRDLNWIASWTVVLSVRLIQSLSRVWGRGAKF